MSHLVQLNDKDTLLAHLIADALICQFSSCYPKGVAGLAVNDYGSHPLRPSAREQTRPDSERLKLPERRHLNRCYPFSSH